MAKVTLVFSEATFTVASWPLGQADSLFTAGCPSSRYRVQSRVPVANFELFLEAVKGNGIQITNKNVSGLPQLCAEVGFQSLSSKLSAFRDFPPFKDSADAEARSRISVLEERNSQQEWRLAALETKLSLLAHLPAELARMQADIACVTSEVQMTLPQLLASSEAAQRQFSRKLSDNSLRLQGFKHWQHIMFASAMLK
jgi:uncharacterized coiled-coil protein SlyX